MAEQVDYDYDPKVDGGKFLNLKEKGDSITIRLADKPISYFVHWVANKPIICTDAQECEHCNKVWSVRDADEAMKQKRKQMFAWFVIDRADGKAKIFKGGISIYKSIKAYGNNPKWGDPTNYDIEITRTEEKPNYYSVMADPDSKGVGLTNEEVTEVAKLAPLLDFTTSKNLEDVKDEDLGDLPF